MTLATAGLSMKLRGCSSESGVEWWSPRNSLRSPGNPRRTSVDARCVMANNPDRIGVVPLTTTAWWPSFQWMPVPSSFSAASLAQHLGDCPEDSATGSGIEVGLVRPGRTSRSSKVDRSAHGARRPFARRRRCAACWSDGRSSQLGGQGYPPWCTFLPRIPVAADVPPAPTG